ncbi:family 20 glycosylhydrolase [Nocardia sp. NBC_01327]|uniref:family 20 glycosylhydrolase n=1 Tax=Nocardia sp. NBC_01327 TaxID=2903593 RepID=UPI002E0E8FBA|nr:family 20 glycosylhydrolase [Nocardia sp. NBC_01327]
MISRRQALGLGLGAAAVPLLGRAAAAVVPAASGPVEWSVARRGVLVDVGRKYFTIEWLQRLVRYGAELGLNELHLHFSENECVRIASERHPEINDGRQYSRAEIAGLIGFAADLGVAIVPEFDMPGHMGAVLRAHPEFQLPNRFGSTLPTALDITAEGALQLAENLLDDYAEVFPESTHWNLGFDEFLGAVSIEGLYSNLDDRARQLYGPAATQHDLSTGVANRLAHRLQTHGYIVSVWNDGMLRGPVVQLSPDIVVHYWTHSLPGQVPVRQFLDAGHALVNFNDRQLYYVLGNSLVYPHPTAASILDSGWAPGHFSPMLPVSAPGPIPLELAGPQNLDGPPYPDRLAGAVFSIWCDTPSAQTEDEVFRDIAEPLAAFALRCRDPRFSGTTADVADVARAAARP